MNIVSVRRNCTAEIEDQTKSESVTYEVYKDEEGDFHFRLIGVDGEFWLSAKVITENSHVLTALCQLCDQCSRCSRRKFTNCISEFSISAS